jgi:hypothetical protein
MAVAAYWGRGEARGEESDMNTSAMSTRVRVWRFHSLSAWNVWFVVYAEDEERGWRRLERVNEFFAGAEKKNDLRVATLFFPKASQGLPPLRPKVFGSGSAQGCGRCPY